MCLWIMYRERDKALLWVLDAAVFVPEYNLVILDRPTGGAEDGFFVKDNITFSVFDISYISHIFFGSGLGWVVGL